MTSDKRRTTSRHVDHLLDAVDGLPPHPVGDHLADEEFVAYSMNALEGSVVARLDAHLASCPDCAARLEHLLVASEAWQGEEGAQRVADLSQRILESFAFRRRNRVTSGRRAAEAFQAFVGSLHPAAGLALAAAGSVPFESNDGRDQALVREDENGDLAVSVSSYRLELEGRRILVGPFGLSATLERVAADQVGAEFVVPRAAREKISPQTRLDLTLTDADEDG